MATPFTTTHVIWKAEEANMEELKEIKKQIENLLEELEKQEFINNKELPEFMQGVLTIHRDNCISTLRRMRNSLDISIDDV